MNEGDPIAEHKSNFGNEWKKKINDFEQKMYNTIVHMDQMNECGLLLRFFTLNKPNYEL